MFNFPVTLCVQIACDRLSEHVYTDTRSFVICVLILLPCSAGNESTMWRQKILVYEIIIGSWSTTFKTQVVFWLASVSIFLPFSYLSVCLALNKWELKLLRKYEYLVHFCLSSVNFAFSVSKRCLYNPTFILVIRENSAARTHQSDVNDNIFFSYSV